MIKQIAEFSFLVLLIYSLSQRLGFMLFASLFGLLFAIMAKDDDELIFTSLWAWISIFILHSKIKTMEINLALILSTLAIVIVPMITFIYRRRLDTYRISVMSIFLSIVSYFIFLRASTYEFGHERFIVAVLLLCMFFLAILGMVATDFQRIVVYSNAVQYLFAIIDFEVSKISGAYHVLETMQIFDYLIASIPFFVVMIYASRNETYKGIIREKNKIGIPFLISCLSMAGVPMFNIFISEFLLFSASTSIHKLLTLVLIFFATICFIMYSIFLFPAFLPNKEKQFEVDKKIIIIAWLSAFASIMLGLIPMLQIGIIGWLRW